MVAAAMESKRLGLCNKPLFAVPNHLTEQWASEFLRLYPSANILVTTKKDFEPANRKKFCARIATGNYDAVIMGHSQFEKIPMSKERQEQLLQSQIEEITDGITELEASNAERFTIKQLERTKKSLESRLAKLQDDSRKDDVITFEQLGVDRLYNALVGKFLIVGLGEENFTSIPEKLIPKYSQVFEKPEQLVRIGEKNYILPVKDDTAVYRHTAAYAREHNELPQYRESLQANIACKEAIEKAVSENYHGWSADTKTAAAQVMVQFPVERIQYVLAATVQQKDWDGRISDDNKAWAKTIPVADEQNRYYFVVDQCHPGLTDLFVKRFREETAKKPSIIERMSESTLKKPSVPKKLKSKEPEL